MMDLSWDGSIFSKADNPLELRLYLSAEGLTSDTKTLSLPDSFADENLEDLKELFMRENGIEVGNEPNIKVTEMDSNFGLKTNIKADEILKYNNLMLDTEDMTDIELNTLRALVEILEDLNVQEMEYAVDNIRKGNLILFEDIDTTSELGKAYLSNKSIAKHLKDIGSNKQVGEELLNTGQFSISSYGAVGEIQ